MCELLDMGVIPIVNENDTLAVSEIKFGDNDTLSAITAAMVHADLLFLMTDVDCLYDKNPRTNPDAQPIEVVEDIGSLVADVSTAGSSLGTGGMSTKIVAARLATSAGVTTVITRSSNPGNIVKIVKHIQASRSPGSSSSMVTRTQSTTNFSNLDAHVSSSSSGDEHDKHHRPLPRSMSSKSLKSVKFPTMSSPSTPTSETTSDPLASTKGTGKIPLHTRFLPSAHPVRDRYFWILHGLRPHGTIYIDQGAYRALQGKAGLLPVGVIDVDGTFAQHEAVRLCVVERKLSSPHPETGKLWEGSVEEVGRCLTNYSSAEILRIRGRQSAEIGALLGYADSEYVAQRESVSFYRRESRPATPVARFRSEESESELVNRSRSGSGAGETEVIAEVEAV